MQHEGGHVVVVCSMKRGSGPEGLLSFSCFMLVKGKCRPHLLTARAVSTLSLSLLVKGLAVALGFFRCGLGLFPYPPIAAMLVRFSFPLLLFECGILSICSSSLISFGLFVVVSR